MIFFALYTTFHQLEIKINISVNFMRMTSQTVTSLDCWNDEKIEYTNIRLLDMVKGLKIKPSDFWYENNMFKCQKKFKYFINTTD